MFKGSSFLIRSALFVITASVNVTPIPPSLLPRPPYRCDAKLQLKYFQFFCLTLSYCEEQRNPPTD